MFPKVIVTINHVHYVTCFRPLVMKNAKKKQLKLKITI